MPARIVVVHDDPEFINNLASKLGPGVAWFNDPTRALTALQTAAETVYLITRLQFTDHQPVGLSLARVTRLTRPDVKVVFTGRLEHRPYARGIGEFIPEPVEPLHVAMIIEWLNEQTESDIAAN